MINKQTFTSESSRWQAVSQRNIQADGEFLYAVTTTGIYCRPTCSSRQPNRENVRFYDGWQEAETAGFRPCKRCQPRMAAAPNESVKIMEKACHMIETAEQEPTLAELAEAAGLSRYHFQRTFKKIVGVTPKQYAMSHRWQRVRQNLKQKSSVTQAVYESGYESGSRFYETAVPSLGMKPAQYQKGGEGISIRYAIVESYLGWVLIAATERGICQIDFGNSPETLAAGLKERFPKAILQGDDAEFAPVVTQTLAFLDAPEKGLSLPLDVQGTAFQRRVWAALQNIQPGTTASYGEVAAQIGNPKASRAVAQACGSNKIAAAIPCHRVVRGDGELGGYRWGVERKRALLKREGKRSY